MIDALAYEPHFIDHLAPVWNALPTRVRGSFVTDPDLIPRARRYGIDAVAAVAPKPVPAMPAPVHDSRIALVASYGDIKKGRRMGYGPFVFLEHGIAQSYTGDRKSAAHPSYSGGNDRDDVVLFLVPNQNAEARWNATYPKARVDIVGCPKLDTLPPRQIDPIDPGPVIAISFHFPCSVVPETRPSLGHYLEALPAIARRFRVIGHSHPRYFGIEKYYRRAGIEYVPDFDDVCRRADVYACDNSSTIYEFASTGRPVVVLNQPAYRRSVDHGLRFWEASEVGVNVGRSTHLARGIEMALADAPEQQAKREAALDIVYAHRSGAAERAAAAIVDMLAPVEVAA